MGKVDGRQIVPESVLTWLYRPSILFDSFEYKSQDFDVNGNFAYGLGLFIGFFEGTRYVHHGGYWPPYASEFSVS
ncbi:unnamed protein product [Allacma fusca]|uniref:Uncharacterized protein n=1 Tax=Allacma fusca TaxID=39272 RepID=A0A8J2PK12_9HEXA|nr:unnamed protein product [Allacma fusca]